MLSICAHACRYVLKQIMRCHAYECPFARYHVYTVVSIAQQS